MLVWLSALTSACNPEFGMTAPKNPGTIVATVLNDEAAPLRDVLVEVEVPNAVGSVFRIGTRTTASGVATLHSVPEGARPVSVTPPAGYAIDATQRVQMADVRRNRTVSVTFRLKRD
jgi:hypothetical protein